MTTRKDSCGSWVDVFTRLNQKYVIINALKYCQENKGLEIYAYCLMHSHLHLFCKAVSQYKLSEIMPDFKKFTSKNIIRSISEEPESRREWMLDYFKKSCEHFARAQNFKVWQDGYHAEIIYSNKFIKEKIHYIHQNPVVEKIATNPENFYFSSARNYADIEDDLEDCVLFMGYMVTDCKSEPSV
jgi:REP element-mobilizing transposase RayT